MDVPLRQLNNLLAVDNGDGTFTLKTDVSTRNITTKFRDAFENILPEKWIVTADAGDLVLVDGNAVGASYLAISKSPFSVNTQTIVEGVADFGMPIEAAFGAHISQRTLGQQFALEVVSAETPAPAPADVAIASISQATTTLSVTTATPHNLRPGARISIHGLPDSRLNYTALVIATTPTPTTFTVTAGPAGTIPSVTAGPFTAGFVAVRTVMNGARNGTTLLFENATATNASFYVKSENGDSSPIGGTAAGNHSVTIASTASVQAISAALTYAFRPTSEYRLALMADRVQWQDAPVDTVAQASARATISQVAPDPSQRYRVRIRAENLRSLTVPVSDIVSAVKTGTTTVTVVTASPHGLTTGDQINIFGARDVTNFPALSAATSVASVVNATTFTVVWGAAVTATTFGGYVSRVNGGQVQQGAVAQAVQSAVIANSILTLVGSTTWAGFVIGDYVNLYGCRDNATGASVGVDGVYRVRDTATTNLVLEPIGGTVIPATLASVNCGGGVLKRTDLRVSFVRVFDFERLRVETLSRPAGDVAGASPVVVQNAVALAAGTAAVGTVTVAGQGAEDAATAGNAVRVGGRVRTSHPTTFVAGDAADHTMTTGGVQVVKPFAVPEAEWSASLALTTTTAAALQTAGGAGLKRHITALQAVNTGAAVIDLILLDGVTERWRLPLPVNAPVSFSFPSSLTLTAATALNANLSAAGTVRLNVQGYTAP